MGGMNTSIGSPAPDFTLLATDGETVTLSEQRGSPVVLAFFPAAFTGVCEKELCTFESDLATLNDAGAEVYGISVDAPFSNAAFRAKTGATFGFLSDYNRDAVQAYGVALDNFAGMPGYTVSQRAVFVVDETGTVTYEWIADHAGLEPDYAAVKAAL